MTPGTDPQAWGVEPGFHTWRGEWQDVPRETVDRLLGAMGAEGAEPPPATSWVVRQGEEVRLPSGRWALVLEDGTVLEGLEGSTPPDLPLGYHELAAEGRPSLGLVVSPGRCHLPPDLRGWGWAAQLHSVRSSASWGIGDLGDLRELARWSASDGAELLLLNPLHAPLPGEPQEASPYSASSRLFRNPLYLRVEDVPGAHRCTADLERLAAEGRALLGDRRLDRDAVWRLKLEALEAIWPVWGSDPDLDRFEREGGTTLERYATFCALCEVHGRPWREWPASVRHPSSPAVRRFAREHADRIAFHRWVQWLLERQLSDAGSQGVGLVQDLAIGVGPDGADTWIWQDVIADQARVGAPPDEFNTQGQDWGLPPFDPWKLRAAGYMPFAETVRAGLRGAGGLRFDHVMGLFRLYWIPLGGSSADGAYVRYPHQDLLRILALESVRAGAYVVGEDLGIVTDEAREELARHDVMSYRLLWFEQEPPARWPRRSLAAVSTHDLPTIAGLWSGSDLERQRELGTDPNEDGTRQMAERVRSLTGCDAEAPVDEVIPLVYEALAEAPSHLVVATLEDALAVEERPNVPGTVVPENWSLALPGSLEEIQRSELAARIAAALSSGTSGEGAQT